MIDVNIKGVLYGIAAVLPHMTAQTELPDSVTGPDVAEGIRDMDARTAIPADSFARAVVFAMSQPDAVDVNEILFRPTAQEY
jgi:NADP-dependent 3-hydroxy acid dehydrogenase YdfG